MKMTFENQLLLIGVLVILYFIIVIPLVRLFIKRIEGKRNKVGNEETGEIGSEIIIDDIEKSEVEDNTGYTQPTKPISNNVIITEGIDDENNNETFSESKTELISPEKEDQSKVKYIGYNPLNIFAQTEPLYFPYVIMPKPNCIIKFPRKGRSGRKGYKEDDFKVYVEKYFSSYFQIFDDRFFLVKNNSNPFEPDFTLIDEKDGINLFLDIEIDEPYEGINYINRRKATHFQYSDTNRNNAFKNRGWMVIRFAEIQVHKNPESCCRFIADVIKSINPKYNLQDHLNNVSKINPIQQWTEEVAKKWSVEKYREKYLGITSFGLKDKGPKLNDINESELGVEIEKNVKDDAFIPLSNLTKKTSNLKIEKIHSAINSNKFISFTYKDRKTITKPIKVINKELVAFCFVKNKEIAFNVSDIKNINLKDNYYTLRVAGPVIGLDRITNAVNTAIDYSKYIRMKYTRAAWTNMEVDYETGELIQNSIEAEESIRTINNIQLAINVLDQEHIDAYNLNENYITAYCNRREEQRTFKFDRIGEIEILDI